MRLLIFTNMYPFKEMPYYGSFVKNEAEALRSAGCEVDILFANGIKNKLNYFTCTFRFYYMMRKKRYDIIHVHHSYCGFISVWQGSVPVVWTFHEGEITRSDSIVQSDRKMKRLAYSPRFKRFVAGKVDAVICVSEHLKDPLGREDAHVLPSGFNTSLFRPMDRIEARRELGLREEAVYVLFPSSPSRLEKRFELAEASLGKLNEKGTNAKFLILEGIEHEKVPIYMNACNLMLLTSSFEASPVTIREALACNVPVLSTEVGDASLILSRVEGCAVVAPQPDAIASAMEHCLANYPRVEGREAIMEYSLENSASKIMEIYEGVMKVEKRRGGKRAAS